MTRRETLKKITIATAALGASGCMAEQSAQAILAINTKGANAKATPLTIPPLAKYTLKDGKKTFDLTAQKGKKTFRDNPSDTYGINGDYLGPTIQVEKGDQITLNVTNSLSENFTLHWHGLHVEGQNDGGPHSIIKEGATRSPSFEVVNQAGSYFYHPHTHKKTAYQTYMGAAGMFLVEDKTSQNLGLPNTYGEDDIPLVLQDKYLNKDGEMEYSTGMRVTMHGMPVNTYLTNGDINPTLEVKKTLLRLRILNNSNANPWVIAFSDQREFHQIATDAGLLEKPYQTNGLFLAPAERIEIIVDLSDKPSNLSLTIYNGQTIIPALTIDATNAEKSTLTVPSKLAQIDWIDEKQSTQTRDFKLTMGMGIVAINGKQMNMKVIDEAVKLGATEIWTVTNNSMMNIGHPFHIHGTSFQILDRNGKKPHESERGWKDVVFVEGGETVRIIATFNHKADKNTPYMYHCHILEHEDAGMMGQFTVG